MEINYDFSQLYMQHLIKAIFSRMLSQFASGNPEDLMTGLININNHETVSSL